MGQPPQKPLRPSALAQPLMNTKKKKPQDERYMNNPTANVFLLDLRKTIKVQIDSLCMLNNRAKVTSGFFPLQPRFSFTLSHVRQSLTKS